MRTVLVALLVAVAISRAAATCAQVKGISSVMGNSACGNNFDESGRNKDSHLRRVTMWFSEGCVQGLKTEFAGKGGDLSNMFGTAKGEQKSFGLGWEEYIKDVDVKGGRCIEGLKFTTTTGQTAMVGGGGNNLAKALSNAYVFGFKGTAGGCGVSSLAVIWAVQDCGNKVEAVAKPAEIAPVPVPVPVPTPKPVPVPVDVPVPVPVNRPVPTPVDRPVPTPVDRPVPVPTPVDRPFAVAVDRPVPVPTPVDRPVPVPVDRPVPVPTPVDRPVPVPVERLVPVPTYVDVPTPVRVENPVPVPVQKTITLGHPFSKHLGRKAL